MQWEYCNVFLVFWTGIRKVPLLKAEKQEWQNDPPERLEMTLQMWHCLFCDWMLPKCTSIQACSNMRLDERRKEVLGKLEICLLPFVGQENAARHHLDLSERSFVVSTSDGKAENYLLWNQFHFCCLAGGIYEMTSYCSSECLKISTLQLSLKYFDKRNAYWCDGSLRAQCYCEVSCWKAGVTEITISVESPACIEQECSNRPWCKGHWHSHRVSLTRKSQQVGSCLTEGLMITLQKHNRFPLCSNSPFPHPSSGEAKSNSSYGWFGIKLKKRKEHNSLF